MSQLKIVHWNCFKLSNTRQIELINFINILKPDIISLQEIKLSIEMSNLFLNINGFTTHVKARTTNPNQGGGVAVLIRSEIPHTSIDELDCNLEIIGLNINTSEYDFDFFSLYNPPSKLLPTEFFHDLESKKRTFILVGDLNSKTEVIGCKSNDRNGAILDQIQTDTSMVIHNNLTPTYNKFNSDYFELLDLVLSSENIANKINDFEVMYDQDMGSDHFQVLFQVNIKRLKPLNLDNSNARFNFNKADWDLYRFHLESIAKATPLSFIESLSIDNLNDFITENIKEAASLSIPRFVARSNNSFPSEIIDIINQKRVVRKEFRKTRHPSKNFVN